MLANDNTENRIVDVSVIIVNWNTQNELRACLASLQDTGDVSAEIIVVDNASSDASVSMVQEEFPGVRLIVNQENAGFAKGSNMGIAASHGRYILLLNPDCVVSHGALETLVQFGDENKDAGILGLKVLNVDGTIQHSCRRSPTFGAVLFRNAVLGRIYPNNPYTREYLLASWDHNSVKEVDWVSGAALVMRREMIEDIGMLDERFFMYCEDMDLGCRARESGWKVVYLPTAVVTHAKGRSSDKDPNRMIIEHHKSMYRYYMKHNAGHSPYIMRYVVAAGLAFRASVLVAANQYRHLEWLIRNRRSKRKSIGDKSSEQDI